MKIIFLGDSITAGNRGTAVGFPVIAIENLNKKFNNLEFVNSGVWGDQTINVLNRLEKDVFSHHPDIICLMIGVNDVLKNFDTHSLTVEEFRGRYEKLVSEIKNKTHAKLLIIEPYLYENESMRGYKKPLLIKFNKEIEKIAKVYADDYLRTDRLVSNYDCQEFTVDGLHLSLKGATVIGSNCANCLEKLIKLII